MTPSVLAGLLLRQPFQKFRFVISDEREIEITQPEEVRHKPGDRIVSVVNKYGDEWIIDLDRVALIEVDRKGA